MATLHIHALTSLGSSFDSYSQTTDTLFRGIYPQQLDAEQISEVLALDGIDLSQIPPGLKEHYSEAWAQIDAGPGQTIRQLVAATVIDPYDSDTPTLIPSPDVLRLLEAKEKAFALATQADEILFQEMMAGQPTATQREILSIQNQRTADMYHKPTRLPGSEIDLKKIIHDLELDDLARETLQRIINEYEVESAPVIFKRWKRLNQLDTLELKLRMNLGPKWQHVLDKDLKARAREQLQTFESARIESEFPLRRLHTQYIQRIAQLLPSPSSMQFKFVCNTNMYPELHTELYELKKLSEELYVLSGIQDKDREAIRERADNFPEKNSARIAELEKLTENRYRLEHINDAESVYFDNSTDAINRNVSKVQSGALEILDADYAYLRGIIELRKLQMKTASDLQGALPTDETNEATT